MKRAIVAIIAVVLVACLLLWAGTVTDVRPISDSAESASWNKTGGSACNGGGVTCYTEVDDTSGATCANCASDGNTTYIGGATSGAVQTFNINTSGIPASSIIQNAVVRSCSEKTVTNAVSIVHKFCIDGTCNDQTAGALANGTYNDFSTNHDTADGPFTALQIGVSLSASRASRVSCLEADVTYTAPGGRRSQTIVTRLGEPVSTP